MTILQGSFHYHPHLNTEETGKSSNMHDVYGEAKRQSWDVNAKKGI